jgi:CubicO group peptidase (beta-lactamase class C family)
MMRSLATAGLLVACTSFAPAQGGHYQTGGSAPLPASLQELLDRHVGSIRLGVNTDHLEFAKVSVGCYIRGLETLAEAAEQGVIPGAVVYVDTLDGDNMPIAIGNRIVDPEKHPAEWSTLYEVGDLAGVLLVTPLAMAALERGELELGDRLDKFIPLLKDSDKGSLTIEQLLRHSSGLPASPSWPAGIAGRETILSAISTMEFARPPGTAVIRSPLNFLLLSLVLESIEGAPVRDAAMESLFTPLMLRNTVGDLPLGWRSKTAAGPYCPLYERMMWGEPTDPAARLLGPSAGYAGLVSNADDIATIVRLLMKAHSEGIDGFVSDETMALCTSPDERLEGGAHMGLGWELGRIGDGSFGWDASNGCSIWMNPRTGRFLVVLTNLDHPSAELTPEQKAVHEKAFGLLVDSLEHRTRSVDATMPPEDMDPVMRATQTVIFGPTHQGWTGCADRAHGG